MTPIRARNVLRLAAIAAVTLSSHESPQRPLRFLLSLGEFLHFPGQFFVGIGHFRKLRARPLGYCRNPRIRPLLGFRDVGDRRLVFSEHPHTPVHELGYAPLPDFRVSLDLYYELKRTS